MKDFSFDCESLGTDYDAPVIAIACQQFDRVTGKMGASFSKEINIESAMRAGRVSGATLQWWMTQTSNDARQLFAESRDGERTGLATALDGLTTWLRGFSAPIVWGNGIAQDIVWLEHAYRNGSVGLSVPWNFRNVRDMRTLVDAANCQPGEVAFEGVKHNALDDARHQARIITHCFKKLYAAGINPPPAPAAKPKPKPIVKPTPQSNPEDEEL